MMDTPPKTSRQQGRPTSESSSDSNGTTDEDEEKNEMYWPVNKRDQVYDSVTQEDTEHDSASEGQAEYDLVTPDDVQPETVVDGNTVYMEVFLNSQVSFFNQYTFPSPSTSRALQYPGWLVLPNWEPEAGGQDQQHMGRESWLCSCLPNLVLP